MRAGPDAFAPLMRGMLDGAQPAGDGTHDDEDDHRGGRYRAIFISDIHLGTAGCQAQALLGFLKAHSSEHLYLVGDLLTAGNYAGAGTGRSPIMMWCKNCCAVRARAARWCSFR